MYSHSLSFPCTTSVLRLSEPLPHFLCVRLQMGGEKEKAVDVREPRSGSQDIQLDVDTS